MRHPSLHRAVVGFSSSPSGYATGVTQLFRLALLVWSSTMPLVQWVSVLGTHAEFRRHHLILAAFIVHALCWCLTAARRLPLGAPILSWAMICLVVASSVVDNEPAGLRIVLNMSLTVGIAAALVTAAQTALVLGALVAISASALILVGLAGGSLGGQELSSAAIYYAILLPVYTVCSTYALVVLVHGLREVAESADQRYAFRVAPNRAHRGPWSQPN